jgi:transposase-like protein
VTNPKKREKRRNRYPEDLKRKIAKEYISGRASYGILAEEHGLRNKGVVKEFVKWYHRYLAVDPPDINKMEEGLEKQDNKCDQSSKEKELADLRKKLELSELKVEMLETMIDQAEAVLSIEIRKKSGTNQ